MTGDTNDYVLSQGALTAGSTGVVYEEDAEGEALLHIADAAGAPGEQTESSQKSRRPSRLAS